MHNEQRRLKVGYVKFMSKKSRKEIENESLRFTRSEDRDDLNIYLFSIMDGSIYDGIMIEDKYDNIMDFIWLCSCRNIKEISKSRYKIKKIPKGYHLYQANIYKARPIPESDITYIDYYDEELYVCMMNDDV